MLDITNNSELLNIFYQTALIDITQKLIGKNEIQNPTKVEIVAFPPKITQNDTHKNPNK